MGLPAPNSSEEILERNSKYAVNHPGSYHFKAENFISTTRTIIVTCLDQRVHAEEFCGISTGDLPVVRCAGGRARLAISDIAILNTLIGINEILLIHHTDCGLTHKSTDYMRERIEAISALEAQKLDLEDLGITDFEASINNDVSWLRNHPLIKKETKITGLLYDIDTGRLTKDRREQNRKAQQRFRDRRKAADDEQGNRMKLLEDALHETLALYIGLSDKVVSIDGFSAQHPLVLNDLQRSMARILEIAKTVDHHKDVSRSCSAKPSDVAGEKERCTSDPETASMEPSSSLSSNGQSGRAGFTTTEADSPSNSSMQRAIGLAETSGANKWAIMNDSWLPIQLRESLEFQSQPKYQPASLQCQKLMKNLNSFASKLVEATLSRAYFVLFHSGSASSEDVYRTFGSTLRTRTREQILLDLRWFLGPGKQALPHASGYLWKHASQNDAPLRWAGYSPLDDVCFEVNSDADIDYQPSICQPKLLTVLGVLQELAHLRARVIDNDTLEIILDEQRSFEPMKTQNIIKSGVKDQIVSVPSDASRGLLKLKLSVQQLTVNLALAGTCAKTGPVYSSDEVAKAVEAAIIMVTNG
ncbi:hypothetical protein GGI35DRAFT_492947 [Trichoderma velutinum]